MELSRRKLKKTRTHPRLWSQSLKWHPQKEVPPCQEKGVMNPKKKNLENETEAVIEIGTGIGIGGQEGDRGLEIETVIGGDAQEIEIRIMD